jgi:excisionase family DNA binding protein
MIPSVEVRRAFSKDEAAQLYGVSLQTINRAIHSGRLRAKKVGRYYRISSEALAEWFEGLEDG